MKKKYVLFVSDTTGYRVGNIVHGALLECHSRNFGFLWRDFDSCDFSSLPSALAGVIFWGKRASIQRLLGLLPRRDIPLISTIGHSLELPVITVVPDPEDTAKQVASHLIDEGLRRFMFVGSQQNEAARRRSVAFEAEINRRAPQATYKFFNVGLENRFWGGGTALAAKFARALRSLGGPVGVFAFNDQTAASCLECAEALGLHVPRDMSIVGVDDHPIFARMHVPLSTVRIDYAEIGHTAVRLIGESTAKARLATPTSYLVKGHLVVRESSRIRLLGDPAIAKSLHHLHANFSSPISLGALAEVAGMSRANFAARFKRAVGQSPIWYLAQLRFEQSKLLLAESQLTVSEVCFRLGFTDQGYFTRAFKKAYGITPTDYRRGKGTGPHALAPIRR